MRRYINIGNALTLGSAGLSSITNAGLLLVTAGLLGAKEYGELALAITLVLLLSVIFNAVTGEVAVSLPPGREDYAGAFSLVATTTAAVALLSGLSSLLYWWFVDDSMWRVLLMVAICLPGITLHGLVRSISFARRDSGRAFLLDAGWLGSSTALFSLLLANPSAINSVTAATAWSLGSYISLIASPERRYIGALSWSGARAWLREWGRLGSSLAYGALVDTGARSLVLLLLGGRVGVSELGALRFAQTIFGMSTVFFSAARNRAIPAFAARARLSGRDFSKLGAVSLILCVVPLLTLGLLFLLAPWLSRSIDVELWRLAAPLMLAVSVATLGSALSQGAIIGLRGLRRAAALAVGRTAQGICVLGGGTIGLLFGDLIGAAWGLAVGSSVSAAVWWVLLLFTQGGGPNLALHK